VLGFAVLLMATGLLTKDGLFALAGLVVMAAGPVIALFAFSTVFGGG
jgi:hypothetical protein